MVTLLTYEISYVITLNLYHGNHGVKNGFGNRKDASKSEIQVPSGGSVKCSYLKPSKSEY
jgi:hypothetical protein